MTVPSYLCVKGTLSGSVIPGCRVRRRAQPMWEHPWNRYADGSASQEAELWPAQDSPPGRQRQPAASRPATAGAAGTGPAGVRAAAAGATGGSGSGGVPGAGLSPGWRRAGRTVVARIPRTHSHPGARALTWPSRLVDLETQACQIVGDEFYDRLQSPATGLHPAQWLRALAEETGAALRAEIAQGADDWQKLWALLCGLALTAPRTPAEAVSETALSAREMFPGIKDPRETTLAEAGKVRGRLAMRGFYPGVTYQLGNLFAALNLPLQTAIAEHFNKQYGLGLAVVIGPVLLLTAIVTMLGPENKGARFGEITSVSPRPRVPSPRLPPAAAT